jgi:hypothetical protein
MARILSTGKLTHLSVLSANRRVKTKQFFSAIGIPEPQNALATDDLRDSTVRQIFRLSAGGAEVRVHLSNAFGTQALHFTSVHIARPLSTTSAAIDTATDKALTFAGSSEVTIPPSAEFVSDIVKPCQKPSGGFCTIFGFSQRSEGDPSSQVDGTSS